MTLHAGLPAEYCVTSCISSTQVACSAADNYFGGTQQSAFEGLEDAGASTARCKWPLLQICSSIR
jgi:hypothetical protein